MHAGGRRVGLRPEAGIERAFGQWRATCAEPWLTLDIDAAALAGKLVEISYRASLWDIPARPVFRFRRAHDAVDAIAVASIAGCATWVGRVPRGTRQISVSPTDRFGAVAFEIETVAPRSWARLVARGLRLHPKPARSAILTKLIGWGPESDVNLAWSLASTPFGMFEAWRRTHERAPDLAGLDRPRADWAAVPPVLVVLKRRAGGDIAATLTALERQLFPNWQLVIVDGTADLDHPRVVHISPDALAPLLESAPAATLVTMVEAGDRLLPACLASVVERAEREPSGRLFYGDAVSDGGPELRPGWSPRLQAASPYLERPIFLRDPAAVGMARATAWLADGDLRGLLDGLTADAVIPLHRLMATCHAQPASRPPPATAVRQGDATAAIIVPTKDHPALLRRLVASIECRPGRHEIVVVDNGSTAAEARAGLDDLRRRPGVRVRSDARPFNFSRLCNDAAASCIADVLVFLNDDMEVISPDWLGRLVGQAMRPDVGAVGARLTYPDGRLQHVGVLLGMGGSAGHFGALAAGDDPGWARRNLVPHEVSAVTGACLAVARDKFEAVGGFDAEDLPVELSDIDLCLKLNARGWQTLVDPLVHLMHEESASRGGATFRRLDVHDRERAIFLQRWGHVLRNDPFFHPGLSLYRWQPALG